MKVTLLQTNIVWAQSEENIRHADALLRTHEGSSLYVLPEMWATGFATEPEGIAADEQQNAALEWMRQTARRQNCAVCGSLAVRCADGTFRNRHYFCTPQTVTFYDKHHLFSYGHENRYYTAGDHRCIVEWQGCRFLLLTCYDLRFPVWSRYRPDAPFDVMVCVANWPQSRQTAWEVLTRARAIENQSYMVAVNRVGDDHYSHYSGQSRVVDSRGNILCQCADDATDVLTFDLDLTALQTDRRRFRVLDDADHFIL